MINKCSGIKSGNCTINFYVTNDSNYIFKLFVYNKIKINLWNVCGKCCKLFFI